MMHICKHIYHPEIESHKRMTEQAGGNRWLVGCGIFQASSCSCMPVRQRLQYTMRCESTTKVLADCMLKY